MNFAIKASTAANFLDAHGVAYRSAIGEKALPIPDIVEQARGFSALSLMSGRNTHCYRWFGSADCLRQPYSQIDALRPKQVHARNHSGITASLHWISLSGITWRVSRAQRQIQHQTISGTAVTLPLPPGSRSRIRAPSTAARRYGLSFSTTSVAMNFNGATPPLFMPT